MSGIDVRNLKISFGGHLAVDDVDLRVEAGRTTGLVGESGSGKSTIGKAIVGLARASSGRITVDGNDIDDDPGFRRTRALIQLVFQDARAALNPRLTVGELINEACEVLNRRQERQSSIGLDMLLDYVRLPSTIKDRKPNQISGGQCQRVAIARALAVQPRFLILDEVTTGLDVSVQAAVLNLLNELQKQLDLGYLFISHNLAIVNAMTDFLIVLKDGRVVESGETSEVLGSPKMEYTKSLLRAIPRLERGSLSNLMKDSSVQQ